MRIRATAATSTPPRFVASRISRLYPSFWVCATLTALIHIDRVSMTQYLANVTFAHFLLEIDSINDVYWTLFVTGTFMFLIWRDGPSPLRLAVAAVAAVAGTLQMTTEPMPSNYGASGQFVPAVLAMLACHAAMLAIAMRWIRLRTSFYVLGSLTYLLYLIHAPLGDAVWAVLDAPPVARAIASSVVSLPLSAVIAAYVERRACGALNRRLVRWFERLWVRKRPVGGASAGEA